MRISHLKLLLISALVSSAANAATTVDTNKVYDLAKPPPTAHCVGTTGTATACVDTTKIYYTTNTLFNDCVYTGGSTCTTVNITARVPHPGSGTYSVTCGYDGPDADCVPAIRTVD